MNYQYKAKVTSQIKNVFLALVLGSLITGCESSDDEDDEGDGGAIASEIINVPNGDAWSCNLGAVGDGGTGMFGAYSFFTDQTGIFEVLEENTTTGNFDITNTLAFTYTFTSDDSLEMLYEFTDGTSLVETLTDISIFTNAMDLTAESDVEGNIDCGRQDFII